MPVILAIEPDRRQATKIAPVLRGLGAELVLADSVARAFDAIGDRIPDLVLTSALLSRQDEAALAARLRELGAAAAHVQELTIPILASPSTGTSKKRGVLSTLRRGTTRASAPDGCEPDMFAAQVALYLDRAAAERKAVAATTPEAIDIASVTIELAPATIELAPAIIDLAPEPTLELLLLPPGMLSEPSASAEPHPAIEIEDDNLLPLVCGYEPIQPAPVPVEESWPALELAPTTLEIAPAIIDFAPEPTLELLLLPPGILPEPPASAEPQLTIEIEDDNLLPLVCGYEPIQPAPVPVEESWGAIPVALAPPPGEALKHWLPVMFDEVCDRPLPVEDDVWILTPVTEIEELLEITVPVSAVVAKAPAKQEPAPEPVPLAKPAPPELAPTRKKKAAPSRQKPAQDEWGFFDPDQCGFAALIAKLDDITTNETSEQEQETTVRVIAY